MISYQKILLFYAIPYFTISMIVELLYARWKGENIRLMDSVASLSSGITNVLKATLGLTITIISYNFMLNHLHLFQWDGPHVWMFVVGFLYIDFTGYWVHRIEHKVNFFWNLHIIHHSSEEFNLACALRQSISDLVSFFTIFYLPMALLGIPIMVVAILSPIHLFMQFWYHTRYIKRVPILEHIIVTPSHHRVHHAMNGAYLDKNFGQIFIFWDKLFGTFQEELEAVEPVYGVKRPVKTWNPFLINFAHLYLLLQDTWRTKSYKDKLRIWFMPTGWRPADVVEKYPVPYIEDMDAFEKHDPVYSSAFRMWSVLQMIISLASLCFYFYRVGSITPTESMIYGAFLLFSVFAYTAVMDKKVYGTIAMLLQTAFTIGFVLRTGDWFGLSTYWHSGPVCIVALMVVSAATGLYFQVAEFSRKEEREMEMMEA